PACRCDCPSSPVAPQLKRQRKHSPFGPRWVSGRPQLEQDPTSGGSALVADSAPVFSSAILFAGIRSRHQYSMKITQFFVHVRRIRNRVRHFPSQQITITLTQTRKPCAQSCDWYAKSCCHLLLIHWSRGCACDERFQFVEPSGFPLRN